MAPVIVVSREEIDAKDTSSVLEALSSLIQSSERPRSFFEKIDIAFHGYNNTAEELFEIESVRDYVHALDEKFPFWLFFFDKSGTGLQCIAYCFLPPFLTLKAKTQYFPSG